MAIVSKTLSWQSTIEDADHYIIGIATTSSGAPTTIYTTTDAVTSATVEYDSTTYPSAWLFVRAISSTGIASEWSTGIPATSLAPTFTPPQEIQYAYANDVRDVLAGVTLPDSLTDFRLNKLCAWASREIDKIAGRKFSVQTVTEKYNGTGTSTLTVDNYPITNLNYVKVSDYSGLSIIREYTTSDLELTDFEHGVLTLKPVMIDNVDSDWIHAASLLYGHVFLTGKRNVEVNYEYGNLVYVEGEVLQFLSSTTNSLGVTTSTYQALHHNWSSNNISIYQDGLLLIDGTQVDLNTGIVTVINATEDNVITANYYHTVPSDIEEACAKLAAIQAAQQFIANATGGITSFKNMNYQEVYGARPLGSLIDQLQKSVDNIIAKNREIAFYSV